jgi:putative peptidoglycan lipid II flippase
MKKNILISVGGIALITILSKGIGFVKQILIAGYFGSNIETDIFFLASGIVANLLFAINTSLSSVILPLYRDKMETSGSSKLSDFTSSILIFFVPVSVFLTLIFIFAAPFFSSIIASSYENKYLMILSEYTRLIAPSLVFAVIATVFTVVLNAHRLFILPQIASTMISFVPIIFILIFSSSLGLKALVIAIPSAYFFQAILTYIFIKKQTSIKLAFNITGIDVKKVFILMVPVMIGSATQQINQLADKIIASSLGPGTISALSYSAPLQDFVAVAFTISVVTVLFTELSSSASNGDLIKHKYYLLRGISMLCLVLVPVSIVTVLCSKDIVSFLYKRGEFDNGDVLITASVLSFYGLGFIFYGIRELVARSFYSYGDTKTPTYNGIIVVVLNVILSIILSRYLGVNGIALATSISGIISMVLLVFLLRKKLDGLGLKMLIPSGYKIFISAIIMCLIILFFKEVLDIDSSLLRFCVMSFIGFSVYIAMLKILKCKELIDIQKILQGKFVRGR